MTVIMLDLVDFLIQLWGVRELAKLYDWYLIATYCVFIAMNGIISGFSITYMQGVIGVEGKTRQGKERLGWMPCLGFFGGTRGRRSGNQAVLLSSEFSTFHHFAHRRHRFD